MKIATIILALTAISVFGRGGSGGHSSGGRVSVRGYTRSDGTYVHPYTRSAPSSGGSYYDVPWYGTGIDEDDDLSLTPPQVRREPPPSNTPTVKRTDTEPIVISIPIEDPILENQKAQAAKGFPEAQFALGMRYWLGIGVPKDEQKGRLLIKAAADQGSERAREKVLEFNRISISGSITATNQIQTMDDTTERGPADRTRVNVNESWEVRYWCGEFGCTEQQLRDAVKRVGVMVSDVRRALGK